jgi:hypothetical protein
MWQMRFLEWEPLNCFEEFSSVFFLFDFGSFTNPFAFLKLGTHSFVCPGTTTHRWKGKRNQNEKQTQKILAYLLTTPG